MLRLLNEKLKHTLKLNTKNDKAPVIRGLCKCRITRKSVQKQTRRYVQILQSLIKRLVWILSFRQISGKGQFLPTFKFKKAKKKPKRLLVKA
jgi:hypothetical protein